MFDPITTLQERSMTVKKAATKSTPAPRTRKTPAVSKVVAKKTPASKTTVTKPVVKKTAKPTTGKVAAPAEKKSKKAKKSGIKIKVVRDSFTMPQNEYAKIGEFKQLCLKNGLHAKKSELLRAGLLALGKMTTAQLKTAITSLEPIKTGRPEKK